MILSSAEMSGVRHDGLGHDARATSCQKCRRLASRFLIPVLPIRHMKSTLTAGEMISGREIEPWRRHGGGRPAARRLSARAFSSHEYRRAVFRHVTTQ